MAQFKEVWIAQDRESGLFLAPIDGDVGYVRYITEAGHFEEAIAAIETAADHLGHNAIIFNCYVKER